MGQEELVVPPTLATELDRLGLEFLAEIFARDVQRHPSNLEALSALGHLLTRLGRHAEALSVDRDLVRQQPECETARYNLACSLALTGALEESLTALEESVALGYADGEGMADDPDLRALRELQRFRVLVDRLRAQAS
ncbi:MAG: hypothetical protein JNL28_17390 [Planctomycetes bacterium]|nr:hypothetical protein [Planctomycetota bacterium]